ncbi:uncharacterized protein LOC117584219 isoform X2 [Drosophila guanche]|uniref:uncharacterized protein LOC117584219 isoform X2 n=1 Tax=Drosophila guanche TaxID=7266 RepID=UPI001470A486|nr:uncharacterized protein LOC117584219 isoform X2 [Drosophila guanche]
MENGNKTANTKQTVSRRGQSHSRGWQRGSQARPFKRPPTHLGQRHSQSILAACAVSNRQEKQQEQQQQRTRAAWSRAITNAATATVRAPAFLVASDLRDVKCSAQEIEVATRRV